MNEEQRRLAAIMFTDMVGYSALAQKNEQNALELLQLHSDLLRGIFPKYSGKEIKTIGDAFLVEFASALEAVNCAIEVQKVLHEYNDTAAVGRNIQLRIGIHVGDIVHRDGDVFGDGVNIAARVEPLARPGGICITEDVFHQIHNKTETSAVRLGRGKMKNIQVAVMIYKIILPWEKKRRPITDKVFFNARKWRVQLWISFFTILIAVGVSWFVARKVPKLPLREKSIAVLPFKNLNEDKESEYFSDGIMEDILSQLSKISDLKVISRTSTMQYKNSNKSIRAIGKDLNVATILEGSVRREGNRVRIVSQLIDARTDEHIWGDTYDREIKDIFDIQSDVARNIAEALQATLLPMEKMQMAKRPTDNPTAYEYYLQGRNYYYHAKKGDNENAIKMFRQAIGMDSNYAHAYVGLGNAFMLGVDSFQYPRSWYDSAIQMNKHAIAIDSNLAEAYKSMGSAYKHKGFNKKAMEAFRRAVELDPNYSPAVQDIGNQLWDMGELEEGFKWLQKSVSLNPTSALAHHEVGNKYMELGDFTQAEYWFKKSIELQPDLLSAHYWLAQLYIREGKEKEALEQSDIMLSLHPGDLFALSLKGYVYIAMNNDAEAKKIFTQSVANDSIEENTAGLGYLLMKSGKRAAAKPLFDYALRFNQREIKLGDAWNYTIYNIARIYAVQGNKEDAYQWLRKAINAGWRDYHWAMVDPFFAGYRNDAGFQQLMTEVKGKVIELRKKVFVNEPTAQ